VPADDSPTEAATTDNHLPPAAQRVRAALTGRGAARAGAGVRLLDDSARTAEEAASALGVGVAQIVKSMVFAADGRAVLVLTAGDHRVDPGKVAALLGAHRVTRADPDLVRSATGFAIGGVAPVGHPGPLDTLVDADLARHDVLWAAAGHPKAVFPTSYDELLSLTSGTAGEIA
jgi:prolyl-tRNA editing enzyme YbaK/EbsC (Cys-tRNA(Pro) deacylase)